MIFPVFFLFLSSLVCYHRCLGESESEYSPYGKRIPPTPKPTKISETEFATHYRLCIEQSKFDEVAYHGLGPLCMGKSESQGFATGFNSGCFRTNDCDAAMVIYKRCKSDKKGIFAFYGEPWSNETDAFTPLFEFYMTKTPILNFSYHPFDTIFFGADGINVGPPHVKEGNFMMITGSLQKTYKDPKVKSLTKDSVKGDTKKIEEAKDKEEKKVGIKTTPAATTTKKAPSKGRKKREAAVLIVEQDPKFVTQKVVPKTVYVKRQTIKGNSLEYRFKGVKSSMWGAIDHNGIKKEFLSEVVMEAPDVIFTGPPGTTDTLDWTIEPVYIYLNVFRKFLKKDGGNHWHRVGPIMPVSNMAFQYPVYLFKKHYGLNAFVEKDIAIVEPSSRHVLQDPEYMVIARIPTTKSGETTHTIPPTTEESTTELTTLAPHKEEPPRTLIPPAEKTIINEVAKDSKKKDRKYRKVVIVLV